VIRAWASYLRDRLEQWAANTATDAFADDDD
jgi:hypothetical protein